MMKIDYQESRNLENPSAFEQLYQLNSSYSFKETSVYKSHLDRKKYFVRYQQYFQDIRVEGGGYTSTYLIPNDPDDCEFLYMVSPYIISNLNMSVTPSINKSQLKNIISSYHNTAPNEISQPSVELIITSLPEAVCDYVLSWKVDYSYNGLKAIWVNAQTGEIISAISPYSHLKAETHSYGDDVQLTDKALGNGSTLLTSPDDHLKIYDFSDIGQASTSLFICESEPFEDDNLIPTTTETTKWSTNDASEVLTQALFSATLIRDIYKSDFDIDINNLKIGVDCGNHDAYAFKATLGPRIVIGGGGGKIRAVHDIIAHEMGHVVLYPYLETATSNIGPRTLHEAISDMFGTYIESVIQGNVDWVIGDDTELNLRDLEHTTNCFSEVASSTSPHRRGGPLGHWFYLLSVGDSPAEIYPMEMKEILKLILSTLPNISMVNSDYQELRDAMVTMVEDTYGFCSKEARSVTNAWNKICVGPASSCFKINGLELVCEEGNFLHLYITNPLGINELPATYNWSFPFGWSISNNSTQVGNMITDTYLRVVGFPEYDYYPQHFTIKVYSPSLGPAYTQYKHIILKDCDGDDPSCADFFVANTVENRSYDVFIQEEPEVITRINVYNIYGQLIYHGLENNFSKHNSTYPSGIYILCYFNENGKLIKSEKRFLTTRQ